MASRKHVHDTIARTWRIVAETGWRTIKDIRADSFVAWRASLSRSAKTKKEYQISLNAFLNLLVDTDRLEKKHIAKWDTVPTRGKQARPYRAFTEDELSRLFAIAGKRRLAYQTLLYTGQLKSEVRATVWGDLHLDGKKPYALFRESTMKDDEKRAVPLRRELAEELREMKPEGVTQQSAFFGFAGRPTIFSVAT